MNTRENLIKVVKSSFDTNDCDFCANYVLTGRDEKIDEIAVDNFIKELQQIISSIKKVVEKEKKIAEIEKPIISYEINQEYPYTPRKIIDDISYFYFDLTSRKKIVFDTEQKTWEWLMFKTNRICSSENIILVEE